MKLKIFLEEIKSGKYNCIFICIFLILVYYIYKNMSFCKKSIENMTELDDKQILNAMNKYYVSDDFANNIRTIAQKIQTNGLKIEGNIDVIGNVKTDGEIRFSNQNISILDLNVKIDKKIIEMKVKAEKAAAEKAAAEKAAAEKAAAAIAARAAAFRKNLDTTCRPGIEYTIRPRNSAAGIDFIGEFNSYESCLLSPKISDSANAIQYYGGSWPSSFKNLCYAITSDWIPKSNLSGAICGQK